MAHAPRTIRIEQLTIAPGSGWARVPLLAGAIGVLGVGISFVLQGADTKQFYFSWLVALMFFLSLALGALFFVLVHYATKAGWGVVVRRLAEAVMGSMPLFVLLFIPVVLGMHDLYHWTHADAVAHDELLQAKQGYLNENFFLVRAGIYFATWILLALWYLRASARQDLTGDHAISHRLTRFSGPGIILLALTLSGAAIDWMMTLNPHWYSTIYALYYFAGALVGVFSLLTLLAASLSRSGNLRGVVTVEHFHDLGKLIFSFCVFWAYIGFSQFFLIWYANIPEETMWFASRIEGGWKTFTIFLAVGHFAVPFFFLMPRTIKRRLPLLMLGASWMLLMHFLDIYWLVMPTLHEHGPQWSALDLTTAVGIGGLFFATVGWALRRRAVVPVGDPRLVESLGFENI
jgi:hypothetical protein